MAVGQNIKVDI